MRRSLVALAVVLAAGSCGADDDGESEARVAPVEAVTIVAEHIEADLTGEVVVSTSMLGVVVVSVVAEGNADAAVRDVCLSALEVATEVPVGLVVLAGDGSVVWEKADSGAGACPPGNEPGSPSTTTTTPGGDDCGAFDVDEACRTDPAALIVGYECLGDAFEAGATATLQLVFTEGDGDRVPTSYTAKGGDVVVVRHLSAGEERVVCSKLVGDDDGTLYPEDCQPG